MEISTGSGNAIKIDEYKGNYSIVALREGKDGRFYSVWAKHKKNQTEYQEKDWPVKVNLGSKETAIGVLKMLLTEMGAFSEDAPF